MDQSLVGMFDLTGKTAIVTGASRGLGASFAAGLAKAGCNVVLAARDTEKLATVARGLDRYGVRTLCLGVDVSNPRDVERMARESEGAFGALDILVNNAGIAAVEVAEKLSEEQWRSVMETNVTGLFLCAQQVGRVMLEQGHGRIVNIASMYGFVGASYVPQASYVASKAAVLGLTRELAVEWGPRGVQVVALAPGFFRSDQTIWAFEGNRELGEKLLARVPMGRLGALEELEASIVYLASAASGYMNGQALVLDGGFLSW